MNTSVKKQRPRRKGWAMSVRTRIVSVITIVTTFGLLAVGVSVYLVERHRILEQVDVRLEANLDSARYIIAEGNNESGGWDSSSEALRAVVARMSPDDNTGALGMADGKITTVPGVTLDLDLSDEHTFAKHVHGLTKPDSPMVGTYAEDGVLWRYLSAPIAVDGSPAPKQVTFVLVYDLDAELSEFDQAAQMFIIASLIVVVIIAATGTVVATRLLRPLRQMRETAEKVSAKSLEERLPVVGNDDVAELAETMNQMLDRLDSALDSQRQLLSDVRHELQTPITIVRGNLEVMNPEDPEDARDTRALVVDELDRMTNLVRDLADAASVHGPSPVQLRPVDIADLVQQVARKASGIAGSEVTTGAIAEGVWQLDEERITQAMLQLAQNAVTHGGGRVEIGSTATPSHLQLWVRDWGPGVPEESKEHIFDRFTRGAEAHSRNGSGLGLNIVQVIARAHGGEARVLDAQAGGACFVLTLPNTGDANRRG